MHSECSGSGLGLALESTINPLNWESNVLFTEYRHFTTFTPMDRVNFFRWILLFESWWGKTIGITKKDSYGITRFAILARCKRSFWPDMIKQFTRHYHTLGNPTPALYRGTPTPPLTWGTPRKDNTIQANKLCAVTMCNPGKGRGWRNEIGTVRGQIINTVNHWLKTWACLPPIYRAELLKLARRAIYWLMGNIYREGWSNNPLLYFTFSIIIGTTRTTFWVPLFMFRGAHTIQELEPTG